MKRKILKILLILILVLVVALITSLGIVYYQVSREAATRIQRGVIQRVIFSESPVYYDDGHTPIGVFFEKTHRKYIHYEDIPKVFIKAIVAAEDKNFFEHPGFDVKAILRAIFANFRAGQTVQGGSTITQQTAKNIFKRERRSYLSKLKELIQALLLERAYTKEEILELYINQFFVTGFGRGLSIASEYFFDKEAKDLDLVEAAFIAGCVKAPYRYNPFTKKSEAGRKEARRLANLRKNYVLSNMHELNFISTEDYLRARDQDVPFRKGKITYRLNVILDYIREQLDTPQFRAILQEQGVDNVATSGISIYTSINKDIQEAALKSLRTHLPQMDVQLNGYCAGRTPDTHDELPGLSPDSPPDGLPFLSRITHVDAQRV
jgi:penicillin-binding protein 1A